MSVLYEQQCKPADELVKLEAKEANALLARLDGWQIAASGQLERPFVFHNYYETMAFVNAVAWIAHGQDHHPDLQVGYKRCTVSYITHAVGGLSENDFICAAKVEHLLASE